jgi:membrane protein DedA with SNARE-associated domain
LGRYKGEEALSYSKWAKREYDRHHDHVAKWQKRWGIWIVVIGRFLSFIRAVTPFTMGIGGMSLPRFLPAALVAALAWGGGYFVLGYEFGSHWKELERYMEPVGGGVFAIIVIVLIVWYWRRHPKQIRGWFGKVATWVGFRKAA